MFAQLLDQLTILLVHLLDLPEVLIILNRFIVRLILSSQGSNLGTRELGQRTQEKTVDDQSQCIETTSDQRQPKDGEEADFQEAEHFAVGLEVRDIVEAAETESSSDRDKLRTLKDGN